MQQSVPENTFDFEREQINLCGKFNLETMGLLSKLGSPNPKDLYHCCVCGIFSTNCLKDLSEHMESEEIKEEEIPVKFAGYYLCKSCIFKTKFYWIFRRHSTLHVKSDCEGVDKEETPVKVAAYYRCEFCTFKTKFRWMFQRHCKMEKHVQLMDLVDHVKKGGAINEWKLDYLPTLMDNQIRCNVCDFNTNDMSVLESHATARLHKYRSSLHSYLRDQTCDDTGRTYTYKCLLCEFSCTERLTLFQHVGSSKHILNEISYLSRHQKKEYGVENFLEDIFEVLETSRRIQKQVASLKKDIQSSLLIGFILPLWFLLFIFFILSSFFIISDIILD